MLTMLVLVLISLWALGYFGGYALGGLIHLLLVPALIAVVYRFVTARRTT